MVESHYHFLYFNIVRELRVIYEPFNFIILVFV